MKFQLWRLGYCPKHLVEKTGEWFPFRGHRCLYCANEPEEVANTLKRVRAHRAALALDMVRVPNRIGFEPPNPGAPTVNYRIDTQELTEEDIERLAEKVTRKIHKRAQLNAR